MKLAKGYITQTYRSEQLMVAMGPAARRFHGLARANGTAARIIDLLKRETTLEELVGTMTAEYEVDPETARNDVEEILEQLRGIGALEE
ncbi:MAG: PqqD family protein [Oscillospiraceae bacterium]|nr:PqqD family protein [Oscillospiraceae bacterium]